MKPETVRLSYRPPYDWPATLAFLTHRAVDGVERVESGAYGRTIQCDGLAGRIEVRHDERDKAMIVTIGGPASAAAGKVAERVRRMFDLDADLKAIGAHLSRDPSMAALVAARPGLRVLGGWDGFEIAARSINGQQVTVERARRLNGRLVERSGSRYFDLTCERPSLIFPTAQQVVDADLSDMGMPGARVAALKAVAGAVLAEPQLFEAASTIDATIGRLQAIRGIGEWTAHYIAMRACREPDAFPASDVGLLRGACDSAGRRPTPAELTARAEAWRPWRAYAAHHLWAADAFK
jgi:AraC family transcriptional regulator, regulatory protein of adaptative response / DNA-3-methyladenine glycosylase II